MICYNIRVYTKKLDQETDYLIQIKDEYNSYLKKLGLDLGNSSYDERTSN